MTKRWILEKLANYFAEKGKFFSEKEYRQQTDTPVSPVVIQRIVGRWVRLESIIKNSFPEQYAKATEEVVEEVKEPVVEEAKKTPAATSKVGGKK